MSLTVTLERPAPVSCLVTVPVTVAVCTRGMFPRSVVSPTVTEKLPVVAVTHPLLLTVSVYVPAGVLFEVAIVHVTGEAPPGEGYLDRVGRLGQARRQAEEIVLAEMILLEPEPGADEDGENPAG